MNKKLAKELSQPFMIIGLIVMLVMPAQAAVEVMRFGTIDRRGTRSGDAGRFLRRRPLRRNLLI